MPKKIVQDKWVILDPKWHILITLELFKNFAQWKGLIGMWKCCQLFFEEKKSFGTIWSFMHLRHFLLFDWAWSNWVRPLLIGSLNSQDMISLMITTGSLNREKYLRKHFFSGKHLCDGYYMVVMRCLCVEVKFHGF